jgi:hypothetical protein
MDQNIGSCLPKFFFRGKHGKSVGEKETPGVEKEIFIKNSHLCKLPKN